MKLNPNQINRLIRLIIENLEATGAISGRDEKAVAETLESIIVADLKKEDEIEKEAQLLIKKHSAAFHSESLDFEMLFKRAKHELAKKKGFKL